MSIITRPLGMPPQRTIRRHTDRAVPYDLRNPANMSSAPNMAVTMTPTMTAWPPPSQQSGLGWPEQHLQDPQMQYAQQNMMSNYMQPVRPQSITNNHMQQESATRPGQSGPWTSEEDETLIKAKGEGLAWDEIHRRYFPHKTGNACRKRHDRLLIKARDPTWDEARTQKVVARYNRVREQVWRPIADSVGEKWEDVERVVREPLPFPRMCHAPTSQANHLSDRFSNKAVGDCGHVLTMEGPDLERVLAKPG